MTAPAEAPPERPRRRLLRIAFIMSLALNLLVLGALGSAIVMRGGEMRGRPVLVELGLGPYTRALDEVSRAALHREWRQRAPDLRAMREERRAGFDAAMAALRAQPFDGERLEAALLGQHQRVMAQHRLAHEALASHVATMSEAERVGYADRLATMLEGMERPRRRTAE